MLKKVFTCLLFLEGISTASVLENMSWTQFVHHAQDIPFVTIIFWRHLEPRRTTSINTVCFMEPLPKPRVSRDSRQRFTTTGDASLNDVYTSSSYKVNIMTADGPVTSGARTSAAMVLTQFTQNILASTPETILSNHSFIENGVQTRER